MIHYDRKSYEEYRDNISPSSAIGECVDNANYDPWRNRKLEDFIKLKEKGKKENKDEWKTLQQEK